MGFELYLAWRYLKARSRSRFLNLITVIAIGGIAVGVLALYVVIGGFSGLHNEVRDRILGTDPHIMVLTYGEGLRLDDWEAPLAIATEDPAVVMAEPFVYTQALIYQDVNYQQGVALRGIRPEATRRIADQLLLGEWEFDDTRSGLPGIVLGFRLADRLLIYPGDSVSLVSGNGAELTPAGFIPKFKKFEVVGTFRSGMLEYDDQMAYMSLESAQDLVGLKDSVTGLALWVDDPWKADVIADSLESALGYPHILRDWKGTHGRLLSALKLEKMLAALVLLLIVLVAAFNIVSTLIMVVADKTREIGILRSMGLTSRRIQKVFMLQGLIIGTLGTFLGVIGGLVTAWAIDRLGLLSLSADVYIISRIPIDVSPLDFTLVVVLSIVISFSATIYPSRQASRLTPVEAIRHE